MTSAIHSFIFLILLNNFLIRPSHAIQYNGTLQLVQMLYRHGDRAPVSLYSTDPNNDPTLWPNGLGELTKLGKKMHYKLGGWLRKHYNGFVDERWVPEQVDIRSTDFDRTLMSAACNLAAFYRPNDADRFETDLPWLPTPIHTVPLADDKLLRVDESCPRVAIELKNELLLPEVREVIEANQDLFVYLSNYTGDDISSILSVDYLYDTINIEMNYNLTVPDWAMKVLSRMKEVADYSFKLVAMTPQLKRLRAGPIVKKMNENMVQRATNVSFPGRMFMYSAHDTTVTMLLQALGVYNGIPPPYAATVIIELHNIEDQDYVKMFLVNDTNNLSLYPLVMPGCQVLCPLHTWQELTAPVVPDDWNNECRYPNNSTIQFTPQTLAMLIVSVSLCVVILMMITYNVIQRWFITPSYIYQAVPSTEP